jgi:hypothetical protein
MPFANDPKPSQIRPKEHNRNFTAHVYLQIDLFQSIFTKAFDKIEQSLVYLLSKDIDEMENYSVEVGRKIGD